MAADRTDVMEAQLLEHRAFHHRALEAPLEVRNQPDHQLTERRNVADRAADEVLHPLVLRREADPGQVAGQGTHRFVDAHAVVVEDDHQRTIRHTGVVEGLAGEAAGHRAVADHGDHVPPPTRQPVGQREPQRR